MKRAINSIWASMALVALSGCSGMDQRAALDADRASIETAQREVAIGIGAANVAAILGPPSVVTNNDNLQETWIYDEKFTDVTYSQNGDVIVGMIFGRSSAFVGDGNVSIGASSTAQRTLTVIIDFDERDRVRDFSYYSSALR
jgi:outer membrane protein assembly factor BamE (lipoprotein component of BamABCDE complex)